MFFSLLCRYKYICPERFYSVFMGKIITIKELQKTYGEKCVLNNISFSVSSGEVVAIIGKNGAGKSTLIKILAGLVKPTAGTVQIDGTITSIIDIGVGFHPDLTGRENIHLVAQMQGHKLNGLEEKVRKIIGFSELAESIDKEVKTYSSGMYLRLAFSIYAILNTSILLLDEVLSVGDTSFKSKSMQLIHDFKKDAKTIIMISHNFTEIMNLCDRVIYIDGGIIKIDTNRPKDAIQLYLKDYPREQKIFDANWLYFPQGNQVDTVHAKDYFKSFMNDAFQLLDIRFQKEVLGKDILSNDDTILVEFEYEKLTSEKSLQLIVKVFDFNDILVLETSHAYNEQYVFSDQSKGIYTTSLKFPSHFFNAGRYYITLIVAEDFRMKSAWYNIASFDVEFNAWFKCQPWANTPAPLLINLDWDTKQIKS
jgi:ABC-type polysaccharide/polyol phosphate transport system ATPase subunit